MEKIRHKTEKQIMDNFEIRPATEADYDFILRINEENVEVLAPMDRAKLTAFVKMAEMLLVATVNGERAAFLIALTEEASGYDSENYRWFRAHYGHFLYIDRIVIDEPFRKIGLGRMLYQRVFDYAENHAIPVITAEIDTIPYNEASLKFHKAMGFKEVGEQFVRGGSIKVSLQAAEMAETNIKETLGASAFSLKDKIEFYKKKWLKEHIFIMVLIGIVIVGVFTVGFIIRESLMGTVSILMLVLAHGWRNNTMMAYVEGHVYDVPKEK